MNIEIAVLVLTILVTIVVVILGYTTLRTQREWDKFKEDIWKDAVKRLKELEKSQKEIKYLEEHIVTDPLLLHPPDRERLFDFAKVFIEGQDMFALKFYFAGRAYENGYDPNISKEEQLEKSIQYYKKALDCEKAPGYEMGSETKRRIYQAMGKSESGLGKEYFAGNQPKAKECYENAVTAFKNAQDADKAKPNSQAFDSQGNAYIELAKMASDNQGKKVKLLTDAIKCFDDAIQIKDKLARQWWATYYFDKARALALRPDKDKPKDLDEVVTELENTINAFDFDEKPVGFDVPELFQDFGGIKHESKIKTKLDLLQKVKVKAMPKRG